MMMVGIGFAGDVRTLRERKRFVFSGCGTHMDVTFVVITELTKVHNVK